MLRNVFGPLVAAVVGYLCVFGADSNNGAIQLPSIVAMSLAGGTAIGLIGFKHINITLFYCAALFAGSVFGVFMNRAL
ncbi:MAG TPA: hypothetical protein VJ843_05525 [Candidatus Saccharimonadales bacterium]|nr:hypothetical protein [Candidatus Saccharimonadales bacterium]